MKKSLIWSSAVIVTLATVIYQRITGPTHPVKATLEAGGQLIQAALPRSHGGEGNREVRFKAEGKDLNGQIVYKRFQTEDAPDTLPMERQGEELVGFLPHQPPAGKLEYRILLEKNGKTYPLNTVPVIIRFKGAVPAGVLIPHILFIFAAQLLSLVAGLYALFRLSRHKLYGILTLALLFTGGFILGPVIQKYAFGEFWTGFPFGQDMTDNKVLLALVFWLLAVLMNLKKERRGIVVAASLIFLLINLIPHSAFGSELDYETGEINTGMVLLF